MSWHLTWNISSLKVGVSVRLGGRAQRCSSLEAQKITTYSQLSSLYGPFLKVETFLKCHRYNFFFFPWAQAGMASWLTVIHVPTSLKESGNKSASNLFVACVFEREVKWMPHNMSWRPAFFRPDQTSLSNALFQWQFNLKVLGNRSRQAAARAVQSNRLSRIKVTQKCLLFCPSQSFNFLPESFMRPCESKWSVDETWYQGHSGQANLHSPAGTNDVGIHPIFLHMSNLPWIRGASCNFN